MLTLAKLDCNNCHIIVTTCCTDDPGGYLHCKGYTGCAALQGHFYCKMSLNMGHIFIFWPSNNTFCAKSDNFGLGITHFLGFNLKMAMTTICIAKYNN